MCLKKFEAKCGFKFNVDDEVTTKNVRIIVGYGEEFYYKRCAKCKHVLEEAIVDAFDYQQTRIGCVLGTKVCVAKQRYV